MWERKPPAHTKHSFPAWMQRIDFIRGAAAG
jgi:hypothetical protein